MTMPYGAASPARRARRTGNVAYDASLAATKAQADVAGEDFERDVGERLGGLNAIGALRSGGSAVAVREAADTRSKRLGQAAAGNALAFSELDMRQKELETARARGQRGDDAALAFERERFNEDKRRFDESFGLEKGRFGEDVRRFDTSTGEDRRRFDTTYGFEREKFGEDTRRFDVDTGYREGRSRRQDFESDRGFGEDTRRYDQGYGRDVFESDRDFTSDQAQISEERRRYEQDRQDAITQAKKQRKASLWGSIIGGVAKVGAAAAGGGG